MTLSLVTATPPSTLVYQYGCRVDKETEALAEEQFHKAHTLYNNLVAAIREIVTTARTRIMESAPDEAQQTQAQIDVLTTEFLAAKAHADEPAMKRIAAQRREKWQILSGLLKIARKEIAEELKENFYGHITKTAGSPLHLIKLNAVTDGLGSDTAAAIIDSAIQAYQKSIPTGGLPHFRKWDERESWALSITAHCGGGIAVERFTDGSYAPVSITLRGEQRSKRYHSFVYRAGAASKGLSVTGTVQLHRPLPAGAGVAEVMLKRSRIGQRFTWHLQFVCVLPRCEPAPVNNKSVAIHMGWAKRDDGRIVAGVATTKHGDDATTINLPPAVERAFELCEIAQSQRDELFNQHASAVKTELSACAEKLSAAEPEFAERIKSFVALAPDKMSLLRLHKMHDQLIRLNCSTSVLQSFIAQDRQLWSRAAFGRRRATNMRRYFYRNQAATLAQSFGACVMTRLDLQSMALKVNEVTGEKNELNRKARSGRVRAAISELYGSIEQAFSRNGGCVVEAKFETVASVCNACGSGNLVDDENDSQTQHCRSCAVVVSRKKNAAANLFALAHEDPATYENARLEAAEIEAAGAIQKVERLKKLSAGMAAKRAAERVSAESVSVAH